MLRCPAIGISQGDYAKADTTNTTLQTNTQSNTGNNADTLTEQKVTLNPSSTVPNGQAQQLNQSQVQQTSSTQAQAQQSKQEQQPTIVSDPNSTVTRNNWGGYTLANNKFRVEIGGSGEIDGLYLKNDVFNTNYVMNGRDNPKQNNAAHEWMGELMFETKKGDANSNAPWVKEYTSQTPVQTRSIALKGKTVQITYDPTSNANQQNNGIKNLQIVESYTLDQAGRLHWTIDLRNPTKDTITVGDFGLPMPFREYWHYKPAKGQSKLDSAYENSVVFHSFVGQDSSYI